MSTADAGLSFGVIFLSGLFGLKEASIPFILALAVIGSHFTPQPLLRTFLYSDSIFDITRIDLPKVDFEVVCSKGTYIRALARDFGKALDSGAYLAKLRRTARR